MSATYTWYKCSLSESNDIEFADAQRAAEILDQYNDNDVIKETLFRFSIQKHFDGLSFKENYQ